MHRRKFPLMQLFIVTFMLVALSGGLYAFQNPKRATSVPASSVDPDLVFVTGVVRDERTGTFISGARVFTSDSFATTNTNGEFMLPLASGNYELVFTKYGYEPQTNNVHLVDGTKSTVSVSMRKK